jgi:hypothetical protein
MADVVYLLGAGFNCSLTDDFWRLPPPLARNFFQVLLREGRLRERLAGVRSHIYVDQLFAEITRYWHLTLDQLETSPFDIEECLTLLQSLASDSSSADRRLDLNRASYALRNLLLMYLSEMLASATAPAARQFGSDVLAQSADVLTLNYDTVAEECIGSASGLNSQTTMTWTPVISIGSPPSLTASGSTRFRCPWLASLSSSPELATTRIPGISSTRPPAS